MINVCCYCHKKFEAKSQNKRYCSSTCKIAAQKEKKKQPKQKGIKYSFEEIQRYIDRVKNDTGVLLSYGKAVVKMESEAK